MMAVLSLACVTEGGPAASQASPTSSSKQSSKTQSTVYTTSQFTHSLSFTLRPGWVHGIHDEKDLLILDVENPPGITFISRTRCTDPRDYANTYLVPHDVIAWLRKHPISRCRSLFPSRSAVCQDDRWT